MERVREAVSVTVHAHNKDHFIFNMSFMNDPVIIKALLHVLLWMFCSARCLFSLFCCFRFSLAYLTSGQERTAVGPTRAHSQRC